nr:hypothetical protein [uncultured Campylobacter sp.]
MWGRRLRTQFQLFGLNELEWESAAAFLFIFLGGVVPEKLVVARIATPYLS